MPDAIDRETFWTVVVLLGIGTYLIRFSALGLIGGRSLPGWMQRGLRFTAVAVLPGLVAPAVLWPAATDGAPDPARLTAALATLAAGALTRSALWAIAAGGTTFYAVGWLA